MVGMCFGVLKHSSKTPENDPLTKSPKTENGRGWGWGVVLWSTERICSCIVMLVCFWKAQKNVS